MAKKIEWSGKTSSYHHKWHNTPNGPDVESGFRKVWFLDAQWSDCPVEVEEEVKAMWQNYELGNDHYIIKTTLEDLGYGVEDEVEDGEPVYPATIQYILEKEPLIGHEDQILIHWWW